MNQVLDGILKNSPLTNIDPQTQLSQWATSKLTRGVASKVSELVRSNKALADMLYSFSAIMRDINISLVEEKDKVEISVFKFPVIPARINFGANNIEQSVDTIAGKINYLKDVDFEMIAFSSFFPGVYYPFSKSYKMFGITFAEKINEMKIKEKPLKLVITGIGLVKEVYITKFVYNTTPEGDIEYSIEFKEAKTPSIYETKAKEYSYKPKTFNLSR